MTETIYDDEGIIEEEDDDDSLEKCEALYGPEFWKVKNKDDTRTWSLNKRLAVNLLMTLHWRKHYKGDLVIFVDGKEGTGKSTLARLLAKLLDPTFTEENIVYDYQGLQKFYFDEKPWTAAVFDESQEGVDRLDTLKDTNKRFVGMMRQSRQAHKILIMCGPSIYDISKYVAQHRVQFLMHCYMRKNIHPGYFLFYDDDTIRRLFVWDMKEREYRQNAIFKGTFPNATDIVDMERYSMLKNRAWKYYGPDGKGGYVKSPDEIIREFLVKRILAFPDAQKISRGLTTKDFCAAFGIDRSTFYKTLAKYGPKVLAEIPKDEEQEEKGNIHQRVSFVKDWLEKQVESEIIGPLPR